jgi:hypothetical protein
MQHCELEMSWYSQLILKRRFKTLEAKRESHRMWMRWWILSPTYAHAATRQFID